MNQGDEDLSLLATTFLEDLTDCRDSHLTSPGDELSVKPVAGDALLLCRIVLPLVDDHLDEALGLIANWGCVLLRPTVRGLGMLHVLFDRIATALELFSDLSLTDAFPVKLPSDSMNWIHFEHPFLRLDSW